MAVPWQILQTSAKFKCRTIRIRSSVANKKPIPSSLGLFCCKFREKITHALMTNSRCRQDTIDRTCFQVIHLKVSAQRWVGKQKKTRVQPRFAWFEGKVKKNEKMEKIYINILYMYINVYSIWIYSNCDFFFGFASFFSQKFPPAPFFVKLVWVGKASGNKH